MIQIPDARGVLDPYVAGEAILVSVAAKRADVSTDTIIRWCSRHSIGRKVGGRWRVSRPAFEMFLAGDLLGLASFVCGDRTSRLVAQYVETNSDDVNLKPQTPQTPQSKTCRHKTNELSRDLDSISDAA